MAPDAFDCPVCFEAMIGRIFQCSNGHHLCEACFRRQSALRNCCPSCQVVFAETGIRNLALEALVSQCTFPCRWSCGFVARPQELLAHVATCQNNPTECIIRGCSYRCPARCMPEHLTSSEHRSVVFMQKESDRGDGVQFSLTHADDSADRSTWWRGTKWAKTPLIKTRLGWVCLVGRRIEEGMFQVKICHFDAPLKYQFTLSDGKQEALVFKGLTIIVSDDTADDNIIVHKRLADKFFTFDADGKLQLSFHIKVEASSTAAM